MDTVLLTTTNFILTTTNFYYTIKKKVFVSSTQGVRQIEKTGGGSYTGSQTKREDGWWELHREPDKEDRRWELHREPDKERRQVVGVIQRARQREKTGGGSYTESQTKREDRWWELHRETDKERRQVVGVTQGDKERRQAVGVTQGARQREKAEVGVTSNTWVKTGSLLWQMTVMQRRACLVCLGVPILARWVRIGIRLLAYTLTALVHKIHKQPLCRRSFTNLIHTPFVQEIIHKLIHTVCAGDHPQTFTTLSSTMDLNRLSNDLSVHHKVICYSQIKFLGPGA